MTVDDTAKYQYVDGDGKNVGKVIIDWVSDSAAGSVSQLSDKPIFGEILRITTNPGATAPSDDYDITILDEDGVDVALATLGNRDTANTETVYPSVTTTGTKTDVLMSVAGRITLTIANAGNSKTGRVTIYLRR
jgi:hypothetical protein